MVRPDFPSFNGGLIRGGGHDQCDGSGTAYLGKSKTYLYIFIDITPTISNLHSNFVSLRIKKV